MLTVNEVSIHYGAVQAVRRVSLDVKPGEMVALVGANGAGKSSLLKGIMGLEALSEGDVSWQGERLDGLRPHELAAHGLALVPEGHQVLTTLSVQDNLMVGLYGDVPGLRRRLAPLNWLVKQDLAQERFSRVLDLFPRLGERMDQMSGSLSGGEQQMLAVGRALMSQPEVLLLDEPSIGLAPNLVQDILRLLCRLREDGMTILLVEQDARAALRVADRGYAMETGRIVDEGTAQQLLESPRMHRAYLGSA